MLSKLVLDMDQNREAIGIKEMVRIRFKCNALGVFKIESVKNRMCITKNNPAKVSSLELLEHSEELHQRL